MNNLDYALDYARKGWSVFPLHTARNGACSCGKSDCASVAKHPRVSHGVKEATTDQQIITDWWTRWPGANIGIATGAISGIVVLDVDPRHGGDDSLQELLDEYGSIPKTVEVLTGGGGRHIFFQHPGGKMGNRANLIPGIDIRADVGYVVAAPSVHASGNTYEWELSCHPDDTEIAPMPEWLLDLIQQPKKVASRDSSAPLSLVKRQSYTAIQPNVISQGSRNDTLFRNACSLRGKGFDEAQIYTELCSLNELHCNPPLPQQEVLNIMNSTMQYSPNNLTTSQQLWIEMPGNMSVLCPDPNYYFDPRGKFVPTDAAKYIMQYSHWFYNGAQLYVYDNGVYRPVGEKRLRQLVQRMLSRKSKRNYVEEVVYAIQQETWIENVETDPDDGLICVENGLLDWRKGKLYDHDPNRLTTVQLPIKYDPSADCPAVRKFFSEVLPDDAIPVAEEMFGYAMIPSTRFEKAFILTGTGANGKSTFINLLTQFIGQGNISNVSLQDLAGTRFKTAQLLGKLLNTFSDLSPKALEDSSLFKAIVTGDRLSAEFKNKDSFDFKPFARLVFSANMIPHSRDVGQSFFRRLIIIPFPNTFQHGGNADERLIDKLTTESELSGLLNLAIAGLQRLDRNGAFTENVSTREALEKYRRATDSIATFVDEMCKVADDHKCGTKELYQAYSVWCDESGLKGFGKKNFHERLESSFPELERKREAGMSSETWFGIGLTTVTNSHLF